jgi:hypothetical protein
MNRNLLPMAVCTLLAHCALCGCAAQPQTEQDKAVVEVTRLGGKLEFDGGSPGKPVIKVELSGSGVTDAGLDQLKALTQLRTLTLNGTKVTDAGLKHLKGLTQLRTLTLNGTKVTDAGLGHLGEMTQLQLLHLNRTQVTDEGAKRLQRALPNCRIHRE